jgi:hypothetical protein
MDLFIEIISYLSVFSTDYGNHLLIPKRGSNLDY